MLPWEIDVAEVTLVGAYVTASGMVMDQGKLTQWNHESLAYNGHSIASRMRLIS